MKYLKDGGARFFSGVVLPILLKKELYQEIYENPVYCQYLAVSLPQYRKILEVYESRSDKSKKCEKLERPNAI